MTLNQFKRVSRNEEQMIRTLMPRTSAADPAPLPGFANDGVPAQTRWSAGRRLTQKSGWTLAEAVGA